MDGSFAQAGGNAGRLQAVTVHRAPDGKTGKGARHAARGGMAGLAAAALASGAWAAEPVTTAARTGAQPQSYEVPARFGAIELFKGEVRALEVPGTIKRVAIGNGALVSSTVVDGRLLLLAEEIGTTSLIVWNERGVALQGKLRVAPADTADVAQRLRASLGSVRGLKIEVVGPSVVLSGIVDPQMVPLIKTATSGLDSVVNLVRADEGDALKKTVHFKVHIMEITRRGMEKLGIAWQQSFNGPQIAFAGNPVHTGRYRTLPSTDAATFTDTPSQVAGAASGFYLGIATTIFSRINLAISDGDAYVLAAPELNSKSGGLATFLAGGEVPIPKAGAFGTTDVDYKPYGIKLNIRPAVNVDNVISTTLETEISQIDPSVSFGGFPAFLTRRTTSETSIRAGETLAISGLVNADASKAVDKVPLLGSIPILGRLFRSDEFRNNKSDLVIFVTPVVYDPASPENAALLQRGADVDANYRHRFGEPSPLPAANAVREQEVMEQKRPPLPPPAVDPMKGG